jgi:hypothetical protein
MVAAVAMKRGLPVWGLAILATVVSVGSAATAEPVLRSATQEHGHVVVSFTVGDLSPGQIQVATKLTMSPSGALLRANVKLRETVAAQPDPTTGLVRWRTRVALSARTYYVQVSGFDAGGVTDCKPGLLSCLQHWSNVRRVVVR